MKRFRTILIAIPLVILLSGLDAYGNSRYYRRGSSSGFYISYSTGSGSIRISSGYPYRSSYYQRYHPNKYTYSRYYPRDYYRNSYYRYPTSRDYYRRYPYGHDYYYRYHSPYSRRYYRNYQNPRYGYHR